jgi:hypothetical protein
VRVCVGVRGWQPTPKEWVLNSAINRWQLNYKRNVGPTSESIRACAPRSLDQWREYYFKNVRSESHLEDLGRVLFQRIQVDLIAEIESVTEQNCIDYVKNLIINRTFDGYETEIGTVKGILERQLGLQLQPASDVWDRIYAVDYFLEVSGKFVGLQIKPGGTKVVLPVFAKYVKIWQECHARFSQQYGGRVFFVHSVGSRGAYELENPEVVEEIRAEIERLRQK